MMHKGLQASNFTTIRLFISSTFVDMIQEREYFNDIIVPKLRALCRDKGVSFFSVDLRWGITEEDIENEKLVSLCLEEVDKCRPFFLGIIGNRYGSAMKTVPAALLAQYPWLKDMEGASYTDLEITYNFLNNEDPGSVLFLFKQCGEAQDPQEAQKVRELKNRICQAAGDRVREYQTLETFGETILSQFSSWLDNLFGDTDIHFERERLYERELSDHRAHNDREEESIRNCIRMTDSTVLLYGNGPLGKTASLNAVAQSFPNSVVVNCHADEANTSWLYVLFSIYKKLSGNKHITIGQGDWFAGNINLPEEKPLLTAEEEAQISQRFLEMLKSVSCEKETLLVINDLEYILGNQTKFLQWIPAETPPDFRIVCSTNDRDIINSAGLMGWERLELRPMEKDAAEAILTTELAKLGKNPRDALALLESPLAGYPGFLKISIDFLNCFGAYDTVAPLSRMLAEAQTFEDFFRTVFGHTGKVYGEEFSKDLRTVLGAMALSALPLDEAGRYHVLHSQNNCPKLRWTHIANLLSALRLVNDGGTIPSALRAFLLQTLTEEEQAQLHSTLGQYRLELAAQSVRPESGEALLQLRTALFQFAQGRNADKIMEILSGLNDLVRLCAYDHNCVRRALSTVLFETDRNLAKFIAGKLSDIVQQREAFGDAGKAAFLHLCAICEDLCLCKETKRISQITQDACGDGFVSEEDFSQIHFKSLARSFFLDMVNERGIQAVMSILEEMETDPEHTPEQRAHYSNIKADLLLKARHDGVLDNVEQALALSTKAASIPNILYAYDLKVYELVRQMQYKEAYALACTSERWAAELGYVTECFAFANHKAVCLYRMKQYGKSLPILRKYLAIALRLGAHSHGAVLEKGIAMAYNLSGDFKACIQFTEECLKNKQLSFQHRMALTDVLKAAYFNDGQYDKSRSLLTAALKERQLEPGLRQSFSLSLAMVYIMREETVNARSAALLEDGFTLAQKNGNYTVIHYVLQHLFSVLYTTKEGKAILTKWQNSPGKQKFLRNRIGADPEELANGTAFLSVCNLPKVKANTAKLVSAYNIAAERGQHEEAADTAEKLAMIHEAANPVEAAQWYLKAAEACGAAGKPEQQAEMVINGLSCVLLEGKALDAAVLERLQDCLDAHHKKVIGDWQKAAEALSDPDGDAFAVLREIVVCKQVHQDLILACISDLSSRIAAHLPARKLGELISLAEENGLESTCFEGLFNMAAGNAFKAYETAFGDSKIAEAKLQEQIFSSFITASGCFEIIGCVDPQKMVKTENNPLSHTFFVKPKYDCKHLDHVFASVSLSEKTEQFFGLCITDIVFKTVTPALKQELKAYIAGREIPGNYRINLQPNGSVRVETTMRADSRDTLKAVYKQYAQFALAVIRELDDLAAE